MMWCFKVLKILWKSSVPEQWSEAVGREERTVSVFGCLRWSSLSLIKEKNTHSHVTNEIYTYLNNISINCWLMKRHPLSLEISDEGGFKNTVSNAQLFAHLQIHRELNGHSIVYWETSAWKRRDTSSFSVLFQLFFMWLVTDLSWFSSCTRALINAVLPRQSSIMELGLRSILNKLKILEIRQITIGPNADSLPTFPV